SFYLRGDDEKPIRPLKGTQERQSYTNDSAPARARGHDPMKITVLGGGPAGLYFSILMKKSFPEAELSVLERNRSDDTFGWGVVFSEETLGNLADADPQTYETIRGSFIFWDDIET